MEWTVRVATTGTLTDDQAEQVMADGPHIIHWDDAVGTLEVHYRITADTVTDAAVLAADRWKAMATVQQLVTDRVIGEPTQISVRSDAHASGAPYLSVAGVAARLGVSAARVRQLAKDPAFPGGVPVQGAAGELYDVADVDAFDRARDAAPAALGRPRAGDEELLTTGLALIRRGLHRELMTAAEDSLLQRAIEAQGGKSVRWKAQVLRDLWRDHEGEIEHMGQVSAFVAAIARAEEMWAE